MGNAPLAPMNRKGAKDAKEGAKKKRPRILTNRTNELHGSKADSSSFVRFADRASLRLLYET
jgi:hypothetical protein